MITQAIGGIGLFLIGMVLVTDGLRAAAGDALRRFLLRFTGGPLRALMSGAAVTAIVQSSSATTVATIGFVGAGLLTFEQSLGLIFGANIGTTATGWIVALLGLKFSMSTIALPLVGIGAMIKLVARGRAAHFGLAIAGFGIIFVGLDTLQSGMVGLSTQLTPATLPGDTFGGRLLLLLLGVLLTTIMQSSSAAIAIALTALHSGNISLQQTAAMVIGINIGTTVTAALAAIGATTTARRTAFAHMLFNVLTGAVAFAILPLFVMGISRLGAKVAAGDATILIASFHTAFNLLGVLLILPFARPFADMVRRIIRHEGPHLTRHLDPGVATQGSVAIEAVRQTAIEITRELSRLIHTGLEPRERSAGESEALERVGSALRETEEYIANLQFSSPLSESGQRRHVSTVHALDHLGRLVDITTRAPRALGAADEAAGEVASQALIELGARFQESVEALLAWADDPEKAAPVSTLRHLSESLIEARHALRADLLAQTAAGTVSPHTATQQLEQLRWLEELAYHLWRLADRLSGERIMDVSDEPPNIPANTPTAAFSSTALTLGASASLDGTSPGKGRAKEDDA